jgi:hypothetical protein
VYSLTEEKKTEEQPQEKKKKARFFRDPFVQIEE